MAIQFARLQYVQRSKGQSSCHKGAYNARDKIYDLRQERNFNYSGRGDCAYHAVILPAGASEKYEDIETLWNTIEAVENRKDSQVAKEMVLALPDDVAVKLEDKIAMTRSFLQEHFVKHGIICQVDIHEPHCKENNGTLKNREDHKDGNNWHAHVLMPTRACEDEIFGLKATHLDVEVRKGRVVSTDKQWGILWGNHQNQYFKENGIDLVVDPVGIVPEIHLGPMRMRGQNSPRVKANEDLQKKNLFYFQDERLVLKELVRQNATFEEKDVQRVVEKFIEKPEDQADFLGRFWTSSQLALVGEDRYTTKAVIREEQKMMRMADRLSRKNTAVLEPSYKIDLNNEQKAVVDYVCSGSQLSCVEGRAGTGKSRALCAIRESYENENYIVRGLSPTSVVAKDMQKNGGFKYAANTHQFLFHVEYDRVDVASGKEVWLIDEAAMIPTPVMGELLDKAWRYNAKVVLVGDERQLTSIERGGSFKALRERFGSVSLETIMRQKEAAHREIAAQISQGDAVGALHKMEERGLWTHCIDERDAVKAMMNKWYEDYSANPYDSFVVLEFRNQFVKDFNNHIHDVLKARGDIGKEETMINTARYGFVNFSVGEPIVFRQNDSTLKVSNGERGILISASERELTVRVGDHHDVTFDPEEYNDFQLGHACTIHGSQGSTYDRVYALHSQFMNKNLFYVANSRNRISCNYFSYGKKENVYDSVMRVEEKSLAQGQEAFDEEPKNWLYSAIVSLKDRMTSNHEFYNNKDRYYTLEGFIITDYAEKAFMQGFKPLYRQEKDTWPNLEGAMIRTSSQHADLEVFLREQGVSQCLLIDANRSESQLIGPYDRFYNLHQDQHDQMRDHDISETQMRIRLFALERRLGELPHSAADMLHSKSYETMMHHETTLKPELLKTHDEHMTSQILYHLEATGEMPVGEELQKIQQRVNMACQQNSHHRTDDIFIDSLAKSAQKQVQFQKTMQQQMER